MTSLGEWKLVMPLAESTMASAGRCSLAGVQVADDLVALGLGQGLDLVVQVDHAVVDVDAELVEQLAVLLEGVLVVDLDAVAEDDRVGDLHHRRLHVQREQDAGLAAVVELALVELAQRLLAHEHRVDDLAVRAASTFGLSTMVLPDLVISSILTSRALSSVIDFSPW